MIDTYTSNLIDTLQNLTQKATRSSISNQPISIKRNNNSSIYGTQLITEVSRVIDIDSIRKAYEKEGIFKRVVNRYVELIWKRGFKLVGKNKSRVSWVEKRLFELGMNNKSPLESIFKTITLDLVLYSNAIVVKYRSDNKKKYYISGRTWKQNDTKIKPIVTLFPLDLNKIRAELKNSKIHYLTKYHYELDNQMIVAINPRDIIHFKIYTSAEDLFGAPIAEPVIEDIKALRLIEETLQILLYEYAIPLYHVRVGDGTTIVTDLDISRVKMAIDTMSDSGMLVTDNKVTVQAVSKQTAAIDLSPYLEYYKKRILGALGSSLVELGEGNTTNKSTSLTIDRITQEVAKYFQQVIENFINKDLIPDLLAEGGYKITGPDDMVYFRFNEIDLDMLIALESHILNKFNNNAITIKEMRNELGYKDFTQKEFFNTRYFKFPGKTDIEGSLDNILHPENQYMKKEAPGQPEND